MPKPNLKGGKKYKSSKSTDDQPELYEINTEEGQSIGRVLKHLGDRNVMLYCNDGKERIAHIRGGLSKKKAKIEIGDIVLYSAREAGIGSTSGKERGDILAKYSSDILNKLKKVAGVNPDLFQSLNTLHGGAKDSVDEAFEFTNETDDENEEDDSEDSEAIATRKKTTDLKRSAARNAKSAQVEDDIDIDAI